MKGYMTAREASYKWVIPEDAEKPDDPRRKRGSGDARNR